MLLRKTVIGGEWKCGISAGNGLAHLTSRKSSRKIFVHTHEHICAFTATMAAAQIQLPLPVLPEGWSAEKDFKAIGALSSPIQRNIEPVGPHFLAHARRVGDMFSVDVMNPDSIESKLTSLTEAPSPHLFRRRAHPSPRKCQESRGRRCGRDQRARGPVDATARC